MKSLRYSTALAVLLLAGAFCPAGELGIHGDLKVAPNKLVKLRADGADAKAGLLWRVSPSRDVSKPTLTPKGALEFVAPPGSYDVTLFSVTVVDGVPVLEEVGVTVVIGDPVPPPPPPDTDPLVKALKAAFQDEYEDTAGKATHLANLAELYSQAADLSGKSEVVTWGGLFKVMADAAGSLGVKGKIPGVQKVVQAELQKVLPSDAMKALDADGRALAAAEFRKVSKALQEVGK